MREIRISPALQIVAILALIGLIVAAVVGQVPELRRYLKIESM